MKTTADAKRLKSLISKLKEEDNLDKFLELVEQHPGAVRDIFYMLLTLRATRVVS